LRVLDNKLKYYHRHRFERRDQEFNNSLFLNQRNKSEKNTGILTAVDFITVVWAILNRVTDLRRKYAPSSGLANQRRTSYVWTSCNHTQNRCCVSRMSRIWSLHFIVGL